MASEEEVRVTSTLYERYNTGDIGGISCKGVSWRAQTFTVGNTSANINHNVTSVKLKVERVAAGLPGIGTVAIYAVDKEGKPTGSSLCHVDYNFDTLPEEVAAWVEFTFTTSTTLLTNTMYAIVISAPSGDSDNYIRWRVDTSSPTYTGGAFVTSGNSGSSWTISTYDAMFEVYGTAITDLCSWIDSKGGPSGLTITDVFVIIDSYLYNTSPSGYTFIPTVQNVFGVIDYYLSFDGDAKTGCDFFP